MRSRTTDAELVRPPAVQMNARRIVAVGTAAFFVAFLVLLASPGWLSRPHHPEWLWTCLAGWLLGLLGELIMIKHRREGRTI